MIYIFFGVGEVNPITDTDKDRIIEYYKSFIGMFVFVERRNLKKAIGVLKDITPDKKLFIQGKYMFWLVDPEEITDFSARPDRYSKGGGYHH